MKNLITICVLGMSISTYAQEIELKSNGKSVKQLTCEMTDVTLKVPIPEKAKSYDLMSIVLKRYSSEDRNQTTIDYYMKGIYGQAYEMVYNKADISDLSSITYRLVGDGKSDFETAYRSYYSLNEVCDYNMRDFENVYNVVYVVGGTHSGYEWQEGKQVKTYEWSTIKTYTFMQSAGEVNPEIISSNGSFSVSRKLTSRFQFDDYGDGEFMDLASIPEDGSGGTFDFGTGQATGRPISIVAKLCVIEGMPLSEVKSRLEQQLIEMSNYYFSLNVEQILKSDEFEKMVVPQLVYGKTTSNGESKEGVKGKLGSFGQKIGNAYGVGGSSEKTKEGVQEMLENSANYFSWEKKQINDDTFDYLEFDYFEHQHTKLDGSKCPVVKDDKKDTSKKMKLLVSERNGKVYILFAKVTGDGTVSSEKLADYKSVFDTFKIK